MRAKVKAIKPNSIDPSTHVSQLRGKRELTTAAVDDSSAAEPEPTNKRFFSLIFFSNFIELMI